MKLITTFVRKMMTIVAVFLNRITGGRLRPYHITVVSLLGHVPVAWALVTSRPILAAVLLAFFSLMDALDGALARVQNSASLSGMYFDAVSDRIKEVIVLSALAVFAFKTIDSDITWQIVAVAGTSLLVSYTKAKGEMAIAGEGLDAQKLNRIFGGGLASYEIRVVALVIGLLFGWVAYVLPLLLIANSITIATRFLRVSKHLHTIDVRDKKRD
jgi:phosphatidylglycerophosphate synthase